MEVFVLNSVAGASASYPLDMAKGVFVARVSVITLLLRRASSSVVLTIVDMITFLPFFLFFFASSFYFFQFSIWKKFPDVPNVELSGIFSSN